MHQSTLWHHMKITHSKEPSMCELFGKEFTSYISKKEHIKYVHKEKQACPMCGKLIADLKDHIGSVHTEEHDKKHNCEVCGKGLMNSRDLKVHMNCHFNLTLFRCREGCDVAYSDRSNRNQHDRKVH